MRDDRFEWDDAKAAQNLAKHGISFEEARLVFRDLHAVEVDEDQLGYGERRFNMIGLRVASADRHVYRARRSRADHFGKACGTGGAGLLGSREPAI